MKKKTVFILCCIAVLLAAIAIGTRMSTQKTVTAAAQPAQVLVSAAYPVTGDIALTGEFIGTVEPDQKVSVFPKVSGTVLNTYFEVGQTVKKGDLLYEIDPEMIQIQYDAAAANIDAQRVSADQKLGSGYDAQVIQAKSQLDLAQRNYNSARSSLKNYDDNYDDSLIQLDKAISKLETAIKAYDTIPNMTDEQKKDLAKLEQDLSMSKANYRDLENDVDPNLRSLRTGYQNAQIAYNSAKEAYDLVMGISKEDTKASVDAGMKAAEVGLEAQAKQLEYTKIYAPIDGVVEQKSVSAHAVSAPSAPAYVVSNKSVMTVQFSVSESVVGNLETGEQIEIEHGGKNYPGTIIEIATMVDPQSGLFNIKASVNDTEVVLHTGSTVKIYADTEKAKDSILIPLDAVYYDDQTPYIYVYKDGKAVKTEVETGVSDQKQIEVITGISADTEVITSWHPKLLDGVTVTLEGAEMSSAPETASTAAAQ